ncbi:MAG: sulfatase-like hydrolase/transferase [Myxococcota bacterium]
MNKTRIAFLILGLALVVAAGGLGAKYYRLGPFAVPQRDAPVVILVVLDTVRADHTSLCGYGRATTPTLEGLVADGATFACDAHAPSTWTLPSHATFFTGVGLDRHQAGNGGAERMKGGTVTPLGTSLPTLAEELAGRGYQTLLLSGNPVVSERFGLTRGFEHVAIGRRYPMMHNGRLAARLRGLLRVARLDKAKPLFAFVNIADAHSPWTAIPDDAGFLPPRPRMSISPGRERFESGEMSDTEAAGYLAHLTDVYDYGVFRADRSLALVLDVLRDQGWLDRGYRLIVTSDHGEYLGEHDLVEHGREFMYEPVTRVPFVYLDSEGEIPLPSDLPSIVAHGLALEGALPDPLPPRVASVFRQPYEVEGPRGRCTYATTATWDGTGKTFADSGSAWLFDLEQDPAEMSPRPAPDDATTATVLEHCAELDAAYLNRPALDAQVEALAAEQLRALGYLREEEGEDE